MTKEEIIKAVWNELQGKTLKEARNIYETVIEQIKDRLSQGEEVELRSFGKFKIREKSQRMGRNPRSKELAIIKERKVVTFKPSKEFRERVNNGLEVS